MTYNGQKGSNFDIYFWRSIFDLIFFIVISTISLEIITAILVDTFSELRNKKVQTDFHLHISCGCVINSILFSFSIGCCRKRPKNLVLRVWHC